MKNFTRASEECHCGDCADCTIEAQQKRIVDLESTLRLLNHHDPRCPGSECHCMDARGLIVEALSGTPATAVNPAEKLREALADLIKGHGESCDCWHHLALQAYEKETV